MPSETYLVTVEMNTVCKCSAGMNEFARYFTPPMQLMRGMG